MTINYTPRTWVAGEVVTAAMMNTEVRDALTGVQAAWDTYTPTWTAASVNPALGNGTLIGRNLRLGKTILTRISLAAGGTTTQGTGVQTFATPAAAVAALGEQALNMKLFNSTSSNFSGYGLIAAGASVVQPWVPTSGANCATVQCASGGQNVGTTGNLVIQGDYQAA